MSKPIESVPATFDRALGTPALVATNVMAMTGAGPFITIPLLVASLGGSQAMLGWVVGAVMALADGLIWAALAARWPRAGGGYVWLREALPDRQGQGASTLFVWQAIVTTPVLMASGALGFAGYAAPWSGLTGERNASVVASVLVILATVLLCRRTRAVGRLNVLLGGCAVLVIALAIGAGLVGGHLAALQPTPFHGNWRAFLAGLGAATLIATYDFTGYQTACSLGEEVLEPARRLPRAVIVSVLLVAALYLPLTASVLAVVPLPQVLASTAVVSDLIAAVFGRGIAGMATVLILVVTFSSLVALLFGASRILVGAARDGRLPGRFGRLHPRHHYPALPILTLGGLSCLACWLPLDLLIEISTALVVLLQSLPVLYAAWRGGIAHGALRYSLVVAAIGWCFVLGNASSMALTGAGAITLTGLIIVWREVSKSRH